MSTVINYLQQCNTFIFMFHLFIIHYSVPLIALVNLQHGKMHRTNYNIIKTVTSVLTGR